MLDAMASGCMVLASDVPPVREVIEPGQNGLVEPLFDVERLTETALRVPTTRRSLPRLAKLPDGRSRKSTALMCASRRSRSSSSGWRADKCEFFCTRIQYGSE